MNLTKSFAQTIRLTVIASLMNLTIGNFLPNYAVDRNLIPLEQNKMVNMYLKTDSIKKTSLGYFYYKVYFSFQKSNVSDGEKISKETYEVFTSCNGNAYPNLFIAYDTQGKEIAKMSHVARKIMIILRSGNPFDMTKVNEIEHSSSENLISHILIVFNTHHEGFKKAYNKVCR